jgi:hypothetical protein
LFNVVKRSGIYVFEDDNPLFALGARVVSYALGVYKFLHNGWLYKVRGAHWIVNKKF